MSFKLIGRPLTQRKAMKKIGRVLTAVVVSLQITPKNRPNRYPYNAKNVNMATI